MNVNFAKCVVSAALLISGLTMLGSCNDDDTEITDPGTDAVTVDSTLLKSDTEVYKYIMGQFVELNLDGTLSERTRFTQQLNEADSTDLYAHTSTKADARRLFLQLLPSENAKLVKANKDSSEMSYAFSNGLRSLTYREASQSANVVATVILPSEGNYQKYANSLTMVKTYGTNAGGTYYVRDVLGIYREFTIPMYFANQASFYYDTERDTCVQSPIWSQKDYQIQIRNKKVHMQCFYVDTYSGNAYFAFVPPCSAAADLKDSENADYPYLVQHFQPYFMNPRNSENGVSYFCADNDAVDVLPSIDELRTFFYAFYNAHFNGQTNLYSYSDIYLYLCAFMNNYDKILPTADLLTQVGADVNNDPSEQPNLKWYKDEAWKANNSDLYDEYTNYHGWCSAVANVISTGFSGEMQFYQAKFFYYLTDDSWEVSLNENETSLKMPFTDITLFPIDAGDWSHRYGTNYDLITTFASKDYIGKDIEGGEYDESEYFLANARYKRNSEGEKVDSTLYTAEWTVISDCAGGDTVYQKFYTYAAPAVPDTLGTADYAIATSKWQPVFRGREVRNATPLRVVYIKKVKISDLGIQGVGAVLDEDDNCTENTKDVELESFDSIQHYAADWKVDKSDRGIVY